MKKFIIVPLFLMIVLQAGCGTMNNASHKNVPEDIRDMFVGTWEGEYMDPAGTLLRTWIQNRSENGTYTIVFFTILKKVSTSLHRKVNGGLRVIGFTKLLPI